MKASVEAETSTIINKNEFHFELIYRSSYEYIQRQTSCIPDISVLTSVVALILITYVSHGH